MSKITTYRDCKYNTSKSNSFVGYCDLPKYTDKRGKRLVECSRCPCPDFEIGADTI